MPLAVVISSAAPSLIGRFLESSLCVLHSQVINYEMFALFASDRSLQKLPRQDRRQLRKRPPPHTALCPYSHVRVLGWAHPIDRAIARPGCPFFWGCKNLGLGLQLYNPGIAQAAPGTAAIPGLQLLS